MFSIHPPKNLPNNKFFDRFKLKAFPGDKSNVAKMMISCLNRLENTVGKGDNAGYQHFLLFLVFSKTLYGH